MAWLRRAQPAAATGAKRSRALHGSQPNLVRHKGEQDEQEYVEPVGERAGHERRGDHGEHPLVAGEDEARDVADDGARRVRVADQVNEDLRARDPP